MPAPPKTDSSSVTRRVEVELGAGDVVLVDDRDRARKRDREEPEEVRVVHLRIEPGDVHVEPVVEERPLRPDFIGLGGFLREIVLHGRCRIVQSLDQRPGAQSVEPAGAEGFAIGRVGAQIRIDLVAQGDARLQLLERLRARVTERIGRAGDSVEVLAILVIEAQGDRSLQAIDNVVADLAEHRIGAVLVVAARAAHAGVSDMQHRGGGDAVPVPKSPVSSRMSRWNSR